ncbi:MAG: hypothetical protein L3J39_10405 [Verrucomicrobiales bacterium]|nr:hypothetical protein [Verrucomicrobiales bacterium]
MTLPSSKNTTSLSAQTVIICAGSLMTLLCLLITTLSHGLPPVILETLDTVTHQLFTDQIQNLGKGFHYQISNQEMPLTAFLVIYALLCLLSIAPLTRLQRKLTTNHTKQHRFRLRSPLSLILLFALIFRIILIFSVPIHESDFYRYLWDGKSSIHGINPYRFEPGALKLYEQNIHTPYQDPHNGVTWQGREFSAEERPILKHLQQLRDHNLELHQRVSHQAVPTIYPPTAQAVFAVSAFLFGDSLVGLKVILLIFDLLIIAVTIAMLRRLKINPTWVILYAWSPLVLKEFSNSAHYDAVPLFFTMLAIYFALDPARPLKTASALALGTLAKFFSVILIPVLLPVRLSQWKSYALFATIIALAYLPFFLWNQAGVAQVFAGLGVYNQHWQYNAGLFALIQQSLLTFTHLSPNNLQPAKIIVALLLITVIAWQSFRPKDEQHPELDLVRRCFVITAALFILSPTAFPWYYTWLMPFLCVFPSRAWIMLSWLLPLSYLDFHQNLAIARTFFWHIPAISWMIWLTFALLFLADTIKLRHSKTH